MADGRSNILLFTTDQQRGDHVGIAGHPVHETPNVGVCPTGDGFSDGERLVERREPRSAVVG